MNFGMLGFPNGARIRSAVFSSVGEFVFVPDTDYLIITACAGGGGGGGKYQGAEHGGASGVAVRDFLYPVVRGTPMQVKVGAGGAGGYNHVTVPTAASPGGDTVFGDLVLPGGNAGNYVGAATVGRIDGPYFKKLPIGWNLPHYVESGGVFYLTYGCDWIAYPNTGVNGGHSSLRGLGMGPHGATNDSSGHLAGYGAGGTANGSFGGYSESGTQGFIILKWFSQN